MMKENRMNSAIESLVQEQIVSGVSYGFVNDDQADLHYCGHQGIFMPYSERQITAGMYYDLASLSKVIGTTTRIIQLLDQGSITLQTLVGDLIADFHWADITVEHLLLHNSGLPADVRDKASWNQENILIYLYSTPPFARPGEAFCYSDIGYILLGKIIEAIDQVGLEESFKRHVFRPLGMQHTSYWTDRDPSLYIPTEFTAKRGCICGKVHDSKAFLLGPCGSAGLFSTLEDVITFAEAYLNRSNHLFGDEWFRYLDEHMVFHRTLGWSKEYGPGTLYHTGFTGTSVLLDMEKKKGFVLLTNRIHPSRDNEAFLIRRKELNELFLNSGK